MRRLLTRPVTSAASGTTARHATGRAWQGCHTGHTVPGRQAWQLARGDGQTDSCRTALHRRVEGPGRSKHDATGTDGSWVHIGCIRLSCAVVSSRLTSVNMPRFPATLTTADDWSLLPSFSDKEEVPGSSPGSPTRSGSPCTQPPFRRPLDAHGVLDNTARVHLGCSCDLFLTRRRGVVVRDVQRPRRRGSTVLDGPEVRLVRRRRAARRRLLLLLGEGSSAVRTSLRVSVTPEGGHGSAMATLVGSGCY